MDTSESDSSSERLQIDIDDLEMALQNHSDELVHFLDRDTGEIRLYCDGMLDGEDVEEDFDIDDYLENPRFIQIEGTPSREGFQVMEEFIDTLESDHARRVLSFAISQRKPFRRFKDALYDLGDVQEQWYKFEREATMRQARNWLIDHGIEADLVDPRSNPT